MNNVCPNCGITGPNFSCPNHTYCWRTGNTQSPTIQPQVTWGIIPLPDSIPMPEQSAWSSLYAEIGRLNVLLNERDKEIERLRGERPAVVAWLRDNEATWHMRTWQVADCIEQGEHRREVKE